VLGVLPGVMGSLQATEAVKLLLGIGEPLLGRLLVYDALELRFQEFRFQRRADCAVCGDHPRITGLDTPKEPDLSSIENWSPQQLADELGHADAGRLQLVDVRESHEWATGRLPGARHVPLATLPQRLPDLAADKTLVFICASGGRSMTACRFAAEAGRTTVNLAGGMHAWTAQFGAAPLP
jgi:adenylyltransferase/sulfurtransferase